MIRFSAFLVAGAILVLVVGVLTTSLVLVYVSIGVSVLASVLLAAGVLARRREIFGEAGAAPDSRPPTWAAGSGVGAATMVGGRASIPQLSGRPAEAEAGSANGSPGAQSDWEAEAGGAGPDQAGYPMIGPARAPQGNGPGRDDVGQGGPARIGPARPGPARPGRMGGYSGTHSSGRGRPPVGPPGRRPAAAPPAGTAPKGAGGPAANGPAFGGAPPPRSDTPPPGPDTPPPGPDTPPPGPEHAATVARH